ncbi:hypothetical protein KIH27_00445 [Mycobacterium sp. M1]|uniref:Exported alanine and valine rich protein n=1 Tax=Mycolicibacter acidiphilus TaxID=2835306 RepID=A0ABS5RGG4_9MYCO|nr:hypothetical protein [Mycolicibacter acidiphilus]MBS9532054.1 hypothetical protein [Mycolicibacter acidiphilus]
MHRWLLALITSITSVLAVLTVPVAHATPTTTPEAPIGRIGDTLRIQYEDEAFGKIVADVTLHDVVPSEIPPGWGWNGAPRWRAQGAPWRANITVHPISVPNPYIMAASVTFDGVTPGADAYVSKHTDDPTSLDAALTNAPQGSTVSGPVYWDVYRGLVTHVVMLSRTTGLHLAQWNL